MIELESYYTSMTADESFNMRKRNCRLLISEINKKITKMMKEQKNRKRNWGYPGSLSFVQEKLEDINNFLTDEDDRRNK